MYPGGPGEPTHSSKDKSLNPPVSVSEPRMQGPGKPCSDIYLVNKTSDVNNQHINKSETQDETGKCLYESLMRREGPGLIKHVKAQDGSGRIDDIWTRIILPERRGRVQRQLSDPGTQIYKYLNLRPRPVDVQAEPKPEPSPGAPGTRSSLPRGYAESGTEVEEERERRTLLKRSQSLGVPEYLPTLEPRSNR